MLRIGWQGLRASQMLRFCWPRLSTLPTAGHVLSAHVHNLAQYIGKGRLLYNTHMLLRLCRCRRRCNASGVCALQNSSIITFALNQQVLAEFLTVSCMYQLTITKCAQYNAWTYRCIFHYKAEWKCGRVGPA